MLYWSSSTNNIKHFVSQFYTSYEGNLRSLSVLASTKLSCAFASRESYEGSGGLTKGSKFPSYVLGN